MRDLKTIEKREVVGKIVPKLLYNPAAIHATPAEVRHVEAGCILGKATGVTEKMTKEGEAMYGLVGEFRAIPDDVTKPMYMSGVCYLPGGFMEGALSKMQGMPAGASLVFGYAFTVHKASNSFNPDSHEWRGEPLFEDIENDPLMGLLTGKIDAKTLAAPSNSGLLENKTQATTDGPDPDKEPAPAAAHAGKAHGKK